MTLSFDSAAELVAALRPEEPVFGLRPHVLRRAAQDYVDAFPGDVLYAVKCNDDPRVLQALHGGGIRHFDTASIPEVARINDLFGHEPAEARVCHYMHPVKGPGATATAYRQYGVRCFALDHPDELEKIRTATDDARDLTLLVRMEAPRNQAIFDLGGKFGASVEDSPDLLQAVAATGNQVGLTFHVGSQCLNPGAYARAIDLADQVAERAGVPVTVLDVGGGFPAEYVGAATAPFTAFAEAIVGAARRSRHLRQARLQCEPGRALVAAGCSVVVQVLARRGDSLYLNDGAYGSLSELRYLELVPPIRVLRPGGRPGRARIEFKLFGPTCDSADVLSGPYRLPADVAAGDWLEIGQMGAYSNVLRTPFNGFYADRWVYLRDPPVAITADMEAERHFDLRTA